LKRIVLGVSGGIAAYRALDVVRGLRRSGVDVHVVMTEAAQRFVAPLSFRTISENPVHTHMFQEPSQWNVNHVGLAELGDLILVCPATANVIGKVSGGIADDLLTAVIMAARVPVAFAPAMNEAMWLNPVVRANVERLLSLGYRFIEPAWGHLACGHQGQGRLPEPQVIVEYALSILEGSCGLAGLKVLVTAGPTREAIDSIRFLSNRSSGLMGYLVAEVARNRGAEVVLVTGPTSLSPPHGVRLVPVESAREMREAALREFPGAHVVVMAAAVADYAPCRVVPGKIKKTEGPLELRLERTADILQEMGKLKDRQILVGFAAESENLLENARSKMERKNLDFVVANPAGGPDSAFGARESRAMLVWPQGKTEDLGMVPKEVLAQTILDRVEALLISRAQ
jgi:phosphopantothenoylcysteine decarboxylase/phosphopantothenate--cysteine ligase